MTAEDPNGPFSPPPPFDTLKKQLLKWEGLSWQHHQLEGYITKESSN